MSEVGGGKLRSIRARALVVDAERSIDDGAVIVDGEAIVAVGPAAGLWDTVSPTDRIDLGDVVLAPGLINAHAHLELSALEGCSERGAKFERWVGDLLASRVATPESTLLSWRRSLSPGSVSVAAGACVGAHAVVRHAGGRG